MPSRRFVPCTSANRLRATLKQGIPAALLVFASVVAQACGTGAPELEHWPGAGDGVRWVRAARGDADAANRGRVSNLLVVRDGARVWLVGSGPSKAFSRALDCVVRRDLGRPISDVISPWPRPELVLGAAGLSGARHWAHDEVAAAMRRQCARCIERLAQRLGPAASDLGPHERALQLPTALLRGERGRLGPFKWTLARRADGVPLTFWRLDAARLVTAHGVLWAGDAPDLRDASVNSMLSATQRLAASAAGAALLMPEQGPPSPSAEIEAHRAYLEALQRAVDAAQAQAHSEVEVPRLLPGVDPARTAGAAHALNWQRAWRQSEGAAFGAAGKFKD